MTPDPNSIDIALPRAQRAEDDDTVIFDLAQRLWEYTEADKDIAA